VKDLITRHIPIDNVLEAFDIVKKGEAIKVTVEPSAVAVGTGVH
jgi:L-iditol 2-dehydrogenase